MVIGDTVRSREIADRDAFQARLQGALDEVNEASRPAAAFTISAGDGVEAVYREPRTLFLDLLSIWGAVHPQLIRFAVAVGPISTTLDPRNPLVADGPAFHLARNGIEELKRSRETICVLAEQPGAVALENDSARLLACHVAHWKQTRWRVLREVALGTPRPEIGPALGISTVAAYKSIRSGAVDVVRSLAEDLGRSLAARLDGDGGR